MKDLYSDFRKFTTDKNINGRYLSGTVLDNYHKFTNYQSPMVYQTSPEYRVALPVHTKLLESNILIINDFEQEAADIVCGQLLYLKKCDGEKDITVHINSYG